jgi:hypothetical protein
MSCFIKIALTALTKDVFNHLSKNKKSFNGYHGLQGCSKFSAKISENKIWKLPL